ncbi:MAG: hypothetical protein AAGI01_10765, partial [Myxococcota bacterium]
MRATWIFITLVSTCSAAALPGVACAQEQAKEGRRYVEVVLKDGSVIRGTLLSRRGGVLRIQRADDDIVVLPESMVASVGGAPSDDSAQGTRGKQDARGLARSLASALAQHARLRTEGVAVQVATHAEDTKRDRGDAQDEAATPAPPRAKERKPVEPPRARRPRPRKLPVSARLGMFLAGMTAHQAGLWTTSLFFVGASRNNSLSLYLLGGTTMPVVTTIASSEAISWVGRHAMGYRRRDGPNRANEALQRAILGTVLSVPVAALVWNRTVVSEPQGRAPSSTVRLIAPYTLIASAIVSGLATNGYKRAVQSYERGWRAGLRGSSPDATARSRVNLRAR